MTQAVFYIEVFQSKRFLRRFTFSDGGPYNCSTGRGHEALVYIDTIDAPLVDGDPHWPCEKIRPHFDEAEFKDDPRWPVKCEHCDYAFNAEDDHTNRSCRQVFCRPLYRRYDDPAAPLFTQEELPPGSMWDSWWYAEIEDMRGFDGRSIVIKCPDGHEWTIDGRCSNCTRPKEPHKCWVRHGDVTKNEIHVDKNGDTCAAGAGSIITHGGGHWFLHNSQFINT